LVAIPAAAQSPPKYQFFATIGSHLIRIIHCEGDGTMSAHIGILWVLAGRALSAASANPDDHASAGAVTSPDTINLKKPAREH